jgi:hypothetical protein
MIYQLYNDTLLTADNKHLPKVNDGRTVQRVGVMDGVGHKHFCKKM